MTTPKEEAPVPLSYSQRTESIRKVILIFHGFDMPG
jgi:hypothetical protein